MATLTAPVPGNRRGIPYLGTEPYSNSRGSVGMALDKAATEAVSRYAGRKGATQSKNARMTALLEKLEEFRDLADGWNRRKAPAPSTLALEVAEFLVRVMTEHDLDPTRLAPSAAGGVGITRRTGDRVAYIECYNDGTAHAILSDDVSEGETYRIRVDGPGVRRFVGLMGAYLNG